MALGLLPALLLAFSTPLANHGVALAQAGIAPRLTLTALGGAMPLRIMPLGASITFGYQSTDGNGYRQDLRNIIKGFHTNSVNMVGSRRGGSMADNDVEGWEGAVIDGVRDKAAASVPKYKPNVVLVNCGTNDASQNLGVSSASARMETLLTGVWRDSPRATILLSTLVTHLKPEVDANVQNINAQFKALAQRLQSQGKRITLVDMHNTEFGPSPAANDYADDTHPNDQGYGKMANVWYDGLMRSSNAGYLQLPETVAGIPDDG